MVTEDQPIVVEDLQVNQETGITETILVDHHEIMALLLTMAIIDHLRLETRDREIVNHQAIVETIDHHLGQV